eukprot:s118_g30.t3
MKKQGKVIGAVGIVIGLLSLIIPYFGAMGSCAPFMDAACENRCTGFECTQDEKDVALAACQALGVIFVYLGVFGGGGAADPSGAHCGGTTTVLSCPRTGSEASCTPSDCGSQRHQSALSARMINMELLERASSLDLP